MNVVNYIMQLPLEITARVKATFISQHDKTILHAET